MKTPIEVANRGEGEALRRGLSDPTVRGFVLTMAALADLPTDRSRTRVLNYLHSRLDEERGHDPAERRT